METFGRPPIHWDATDPRGPQTMTPLRSLSTMLALALVGCGEVSETHNTANRPAPTATAVGRGNLPEMRGADASTPASLARPVNDLFRDHAVAATVATQPGTTSRGG